MNNSTKESILEVSPTSGASQLRRDVMSLRRGEAPLPCLYRNNSIENTQNNHPQPNKDALLKAISTDKKYRKTSTALSANVVEFSVKYGLEKLGFLTLTFSDHVTCYKEASKRFNSLASNVLNHRYQAFIKVMERQKSGRIHYHLIVALNEDIRSGFKFSDISKGNYKSAGLALRSCLLYTSDAADEPI